MSPASSPRTLVLFRAVARACLLEALGISTRGWGLTGFAPWLTEYATGSPSTGFEPLPIHALPCVQAAPDFSALSMQTDMRRSPIWLAVGEYSYLYIGGAGERHELLSWKYEDCPPLVAMLFRPEEKELSVESDTDIEGETIESAKILYRTTASRARERLTSVGLDYERIRKMAADVLAMQPDEVLAAIEGRRYAEDESWDAEIIMEVLAHEGQDLIAELLIVWNELNSAGEDALVLFDPSEVTASRGPKEIEGRDLLIEARNALRVRRHVVASLLDFVTKPTPEAEDYVIKRMIALDEDAFLRKVVVPVLEAEGYGNVKVIEHHGPSEMGSDTKILRKLEMGKWEYAGAQAKGARVSQDDAPHIRSQVETALTVEFTDDADRNRKRLDRVMLFLGQGATANALAVLHAPYTKSVKIFDPTDIARLVLKHDLLGNLT